jgi:hypothetical protein
MKNKLVYLFFILPFFCHSQEWFTSGANWTYDITRQSTPGAENLSVEKDTMINGQLWSKLSGKRYINRDAVIYYDHNPIYTQYKNDTVFVLIDQKVEPIYFFKAKVGDTIRHINYHYPLAMLSSCRSEVSLRIDTAGITQINNEPLRYYTATTLPENNFPIQRIKVIEKIGAVNHYIIPFFSCLLDIDDYRFRCYQDSYTSVFSINGVDNCDFLPTNMHITEQNNFLIYPNPVSEKLKLELKDINAVEIYNLQGQLFLRNTEFSEAFEIDVSTWTNGMYFLNVFDLQGQVKRVSFIKK